MCNQSFQICLLAFCLLINVSSCKRETANYRIPKGYRLLEQINCDLNKDGKNDDVLVITKDQSIQKAQNETVQDLNFDRRSIIVAFYGDGSSRGIRRFMDCIPVNQDNNSTKVDVTARKGNLYFTFSEGLNQKKYTFRFQNDDFELIGYDERKYFGSELHQIVSINFSTGKRILRTKINSKFVETISSIGESEPCRLSNQSALDNFTVDL